MQWKNPFQKKSYLDTKSTSGDKDRERIEETLSQMPEAKDMNLVQRFMMKRFLNMKPEDRAKVLEKAMKPENVAKHKTEILAQLESLKRSGQMSDDQYRLAKRRLGI